MRKRLLALVFVAGALAVGPVTAASADTGDTTPTRTSVSASDGTVRVSLPGREGRPPVAQFGRYWS
jgi:hypothetical protein